MLRRGFDELGLRQRRHRLQQLRRDLENAGRNINPEENVLFGNEDPLRQNLDDLRPHGHQFDEHDDVHEGEHGLEVFDDVPINLRIGQQQIAINEVLLQNNGITRNGENNEDNLQRPPIVADAESVDWDAGNNEALLEDNEDEEIAVDQDVETNQEDLEINLINMQHEEDDEADFYNGQPLYRGSFLSVGESMLLILMILLRHNINYEYLADIISVINMHCLQDNFKKISLNRFKTFFSLDANSIIKHYYCSKCIKLFAGINDDCRTCEDWKREYFVQFPFIDQLKEMFKRDHFFFTFTISF